MKTVCAAVVGMMVAVEGMGCLVCVLVTEVDMVVG